MKLTTRESHVLEQMDFGKTNAQIAETLGIKIGTVKAHKKAIRIKVQAAVAAGELHVPDRRPTDPERISTPIPPAYDPHIEETEPFEPTRCPRS